MRTSHLDLDSHEAEVIREALNLLREVAQEDASLSVEDYDKGRFSAEAIKAEQLLQRLNSLT